MAPPNGTLPPNANGTAFPSPNGGSPEVGGTVEVEEKKSLDEVYLDELLGRVWESGASDLHLAVGRPPCVRLHGKIRELNDYEIFRPSVVQRMMYDILSDEQIQRFENDWELDFAYSAQYIARFRVNVYRDRGNIAAALRVIPSQIPSAEKLGIPPVIMDLAHRPRGLMLVTGPTGSGKSTTLAAVIDRINQTRDEHIITIEDPIEFLHEHKKCIVNQREVGADTRAFANALRASLREDPDVILVGEMRDNETIHLAISAAETGHLVFGTLHTNSAAESIDRMVGVFPSEQQEQIRTQLSNSLVAIVSQQLLPKVGGGRIGAVEVMIANSAIRNLVRENKAHQMTSIIQTQGGIGMQTMDQALRDLYHKGLITYDDAMARAHNAAELEVMMLNREGGMEGMGGMPGR
ncbi:MAG: type IV pilus twitching motility protein PilT [Abitibacteriaceae bacterium]|nr:type IV pilus twitching motility protein PilT [Abditibacteriaceae bacterium]MBV9867891.1 type IV pilus twitching motility protein PilT [Abditibacteriaceae bacterium]